MAGCGRGPSPQPRGSAVSRVSAEPPPLGFSVQGRPILVSCYGVGPTVVLIVGGIHGNEPAGAVLPRQLCAHLDTHPAIVRGRQVVVATAVNPDGLARGTRANAHGVDLNRNFATPNWRASRRHGAKPFSEPETRFIAELIRRFRPTRVVQLHQPLRCVDWDGPGRALAAAMAEACGLPLKKLGGRPGSLGSYAGTKLGIPTVTLEMPRSATGLKPDALWARYGEALLVAVRLEGSDRKPMESFPKVQIGGEVRLRWEHTR